MMIELLVAGAVLGFFGGPLLLYGLGSIILLFRDQSNRRMMDSMRREHNRCIRECKQRYNRLRRKFDHKTLKMQRLLAKGKPSYNGNGGG